MILGRLRLPGHRLRLPGRLIDRYLLLQLLRPMTLSLAFVLVALLMERVLRLVDLIAAEGGPFGAVATMAATLLPHYLGLALPAAFFISILLLVARLAEDSEIDALLASGLSLVRIVMPFIAAGLVLALMSLALFGYVQPHARYGYRAALHLVKHGGWTGAVPGGSFVDAGNGVTLHAAEADSTGRVLTGVLIEERDADGRSVTTTAAQGFLRSDPERSGRLILVLVDGSQMRVSRGGAVSALTFETLTIGREFALADALFRPRGRDERELTLGELQDGVRTGDGPVPPAVMNGELHGRLVQAASVAVLPLLAVPMGIAAKRRRRGAGMVLAAVVLVLFHHVLQVGQGLVELGRVGPAIGSWLPLSVLAAVAGWMLFQMNERPGRGPLDGALGAIDRSIDAARAYIGRLAGRPT